MKYVDEIYPFGLNTTIGPTGTIKRLFRNSDFFTNRGYEMTIFALQAPSDNNTLCEIHSLPEASTSSLSVPINNNGNGLKSILKSKKHAIAVNYYLASAFSRKIALRANARYIKDYINFNRKPDIVVFHEMDSCFHYLKYRDSCSSKVVLFIHGDGSDGEMFLKRFPKFAGKREYKDMLANLLFCYKQCDCIVWISKLAKERFCHHHPEYAHKSVAVVNGIDDILPIERIVDSDFKYRLVTTGTVCERKGQYIIVEAMHRMKKEVLKDTHLTIIGSGPDYAYLKTLSEEYGLNNHISFTGSVLNSDVPNYLAKENIYVLMSNNEGLPISIIEAMRSGLPVISTQVAGIPEEVDERNGLLIEPDINQLVEILDRLPEHNWERMGISSRRRFEEEFTFQIMREKYADMFESLL